ncbi:MAG: BrnT family toxin [Phycisphaerales bacterium]|nr:BrnT family toxin [Hyphomonadaceae bacterium]
MGETDEFEWDDGKDAVNQQKHGVELIVAAAMFDDPDRLEQVSGRSTAAETRLITVARAFGVLWTCVYTWRGLKRRLISLRRAHRTERRAYQRRP